MITNLVIRCSQSYRLGYTFADSVFSLTKEINWHPMMKESDFFVPRWKSFVCETSHRKKKTEREREKVQRNLWIFVIRREGEGAEEQNVARVSKKKIPAARRLRLCALIRKIRAILNSVPNIRSRGGEIFAKVGRASR